LAGLFHQRGHTLGDCRHGTVAQGAVVSAALMGSADGAIAGFQDKPQPPPSGEGAYSPRCERGVFQTAMRLLRIREIPSGNAT